MIHHLAILLAFCVIGRAGEALPLPLRSVIISLRYTAPGLRWTAGEESDDILLYDESISYVVSIHDCPCYLY